MGWDGANLSGHTVGAGVYFIRARIGGRAETISVVRIE
jgi:hypothetical protein